MTTVNLQVGAGNDDASEKDDGSSFKSAGVQGDIIASGTASTRENCGFVFDSVAIPFSPKVTAADLQLYLITNDDPECDIYCEDVDDADDFGTTADVTSRTTTTASVEWSDTSVGSGAFISAPDISVCVQEVLDRAGWASGNSLCVIAKGKSSGSGTATVVQYDFSAGNAAKLDITYTDRRPTRAAQTFMRRRTA